MATTGGKALLLVLGVLGVSAQVGCSKAQRSLNKKSDGVIVQVQPDSESKSQEEIQSLFPTNKVTVVSAEDRIYKIQNAKLEDVAERLPSSYAEEDIYINMKDPSYDVTNKPEFSKRASIQETIDKLGCIELPGGPKASFDLVNQPNLVANNTVEAGSEVLEFEALQVGSNVTLNWVVEAPPGSKTQEESNEREISVNPDRAGTYIVALIVQDPSTSACDLTGVIVGATHNKSYDGGSGTKGTYSSQKFFHVPLVNGEEAWETTTGEGVTIAIIDSGVNYNHPDLADNIKMNEKEIAGNGIDDDKNGQVDDVYGWDFAIGDEYPFDDESHGTHVAGLAASSVSGIAKGAKILPVKAMLPTGQGSLSSIVAAVYYAVKQKADVINMSLGGEGPTNPMLLAAIKKAQAAGIIVVAASGNSSDNTDVVDSHLTSKDGSNVLAIAATDEFDSLTDYSNYGVKTVDIAAPGGTRKNPLVSTYAATDLGMYVGYPGTSMASPVVAGIAALVKSVNPDLTAEQIKSVIVESGKNVSALKGKVTSGKVVDAAAAVRAASLNNMPLAAGL